MNFALKKSTVCTVIVTYNRKNLLKECIQAVQSQTRQPDQILVVDNASTDGTAEMLANDFPLVIHLRLPENTGGAGGFHEGMKWAYEHGFDWIWVMDDDVLPKPNALLELVTAYNFLEKPGFVASKVISEDGYSMNVPLVDSRPSISYYPDWDKYLEKGIVKIQTATFVSLLFPRETIKQCGLPIKEFFIWGDDTEYTHRITNSGFYAYMIGSSIVIHKRQIVAPISIFFEENVKRLNLYVYFYRNHFYYIKSYKRKRDLIAFYILSVLTILRVFKSKQSNKWKKTKVIIQGLWAGLWFNPLRE